METIDLEILCGNTASDTIRVSNLSQTIGYLVLPTPCPTGLEVIMLANTLSQSDWVLLGGHKVKIFVNGKPLSCLNCGKELEFECPREYAQWETVYCSEACREEHESQSHITRCLSTCPRETPWSTQLKACDLVAMALNVHTRCTLPLGHAGNHIGPDDTTWKESKP